MDLSLDRALRQTTTSPHLSIQPDVPLSLLPDITPNLIDMLNQHGAILQLPPRPRFTDIQVAKKSILLSWEVQDQYADVSSDRTLTFSLHCYGDIPYRLERKLTFKRRLRRLITPESGFEDMSEMGSESRSTFPSLPPSLLGSRAASMAPHPEHREGAGQGSNNQIITEESEEHDRYSTEKPNGSKRTLPSLLPEPIIRLSKRRDETKLPQLDFQSSDILNPALPGRDASQLGSGYGSSILNLPPLIHGKQDQPVSTQSATTSGTFEEAEDAVEESEQSDQRRPDSSTSLSELSDEVKVNEYTDLGRFCQGYAFEEIYSGEGTDFQYSGLVAGASYFFRVRCHNAAGWGAWSDTVKCMTTFN